MKFFNNVPPPLVIHNNLIIHPLTELQHDQVIEKLKDARIKIKKKIQQLAHVKSTIKYHKLTVLHVMLHCLNTLLENSSYAVDFEDALHAIEKAKENNPLYTRQLFKNTTSETQTLMDDITLIIQNELRRLSSQRNSSRFPI